MPTWSEIIARGPNYWTGQPGGPSTAPDVLALIAQMLANPTGPLLVQPGSAALPGLAFLGDPDTGLTRPAANQIGLATAGVIRALLSAAGFQIDVPITGSAVQANALDITAGRLLKVGAFGLGTFQPDAVADMAIPGPSGFTRNTTGTGSPDGAGSWTMLDFPFSGTGGAQIAIKATTGETHIRNRAAGSWGAWRRQYDTRSVLAAVGMASGLPTGGLFDYASLPAGWYLKLADGTMICGSGALGALTPDTAVGSNWISAGQVWTYPALFTGIPAVVAAPQTAGRWATIGTTTTTQTNVQVLSSVQQVSPGTVRLLAIGRWL